MNAAEVRSWIPGFTPTTVISRVVTRQARKLFHRSVPCCNRRRAFRPWRNVRIIPRVELLIQCHRLGLHLDFLGTHRVLQSKYGIVVQFVSPTEESAVAAGPVLAVAATHKKCCARATTWVVGTDRPTLGESRRITVRSVSASHANKLVDRSFGPRGKWRE